MTEEMPESVEKRTKEDGKFLGIMAQEFPDVSFGKVLKAAEQSTDSASIASEASDTDFTAIIQNVGQRTSIEKITTNLRATTQGKGLFIAGAAITAAALSLTFLVKRFRNRQTAQQTGIAPQAANITEQQAAAKPTRSLSAPSSTSSIISQIGDVTGIDKSVTGAAQKLASGEGLSLADVVKAGTALAAAKGGETGQANENLAAVGQLANTLSGANGQGAQLPDMLSSVMGLFNGGQNANRTR